MTLKKTLLLLTLTAYWISSNIAVAHPYSNPKKENSKLGTELSHRTARQAYFAFGDNIAIAIVNARCNSEGGCREGLCWSGCGFYPFSKKWCYTTKPGLEFTGYADCKTDSDCNSCWNCANQCDSYRYI